MPCFNSLLLCCSTNLAAYALFLPDISCTSLHTLPNLAKPGIPVDLLYLLIYRFCFGHIICLIQHLLCLIDLNPFLFGQVNTVTLVGICMAYYVLYFIIIIIIFQPLSQFSHFVVFAEFSLGNTLLQFGQQVFSYLVVNLNKLAIVGVGAVVHFPQGTKC